MHYWRGINNLIVRENLNLLLSRKPCPVNNQSFSKCTRYFASNPKPSTQMKNGIKTLQSMATHNEKSIWLLPIRKLSSTKALFSAKGSNTKQLDRQVMFLNLSLIGALLVCIYIGSTMEYHQDYVIIEPDDKK